MRLRMKTETERDTNSKLSGRFGTETAIQVPSVPG